jgi:hypothetical protein
MDMADLVYQPPGIYINEQPEPMPNLPSVVALPPARIALVGPSRGYQQNTETIQMSTTPTPLSKRGIDDDTITVTALDGTLYALTTDYTVTQTGTTSESVTTITRNSGGMITTEGAVVYISYQFTDSSYYEPYQSTDWDEIQARYGQAIDPTTGAVGSALSLAARIAIEQGALDLVLVPTLGSATPSTVTAAQLKQGLDKLLARDDVGVVVSLAVGIGGSDVSAGETKTVADDLKAHVQTATNGGQYRIGIIGYDTMVTRSFDQAALAINYERIMLAYPQAMNWYNGLTNTTMEIGGPYLAAAYAGMMASYAVQIPLTRKLVRSFSSIPSRIRGSMTMAFRNTLSANGVSVTEQTTDGRLVIRHALSTDPRNVLSREISITRSKDALLRLIYLSIDTSQIIGTAADEESPERLRGIVEGALNQADQANVIISWSNLSVRRSPLDLTRMEVKFAYEPAFPLNQIVVSFSISTTTGAITTTNA